MTPARIRLVLAAIGTLIAALPFVVPALAQYTELAILVGSTLGGAVLFRRPGDAPAGITKITYSAFGLDSADEATLRDLEKQVRSALDALQKAGAP